MQEVENENEKTDAACWLDDHVKNGENIRKKNKNTDKKPKKSTGMKKLRSWFGDSSSEDSSTDSSEEEASEN